MERFNLDTWLEDKSRKIIDDNGFPVEIIKWDANEKYPVVLLDHNGIAYNVSVDGMYDVDSNHGLFFADNEPYNPYKSAVESIVKMVEKYEPYYRFDIDSNLSDFLNNVKAKCKVAMEYDKMFTQEEFVSKKQYEEDLGKAYKNADTVQFNRGMAEVLNNPKRYFHVGDTIRLKNSNAEHTITSISNGKYYGEGWSLDISRAANYELVEDCNHVETPQEITNNLPMNIIGQLKELQEEMEKHAKHLEAETYFPYTQAECFSKRLDDIIKSIEA